MGTLTRKQREIQQRELRLLDVARTMLLEHGYAGLSMDRLAEVTEYSKGTIYQHFTSKEDLVTALAVQSMEHRRRLFERAFAFRGRPRERMHAICVADDLFVMAYPNFYHSDMIIKMANLEGRVSSSRQEEFSRNEGCCIGFIQEIVKDAMACGDLKLSEHYHSGDVVFAIISMAIGAQFVARNFQNALQELRVTKPQESVEESLLALFDGLHWHPLRSEWDYEATQRRIIEEVFADEWRRVGAGES